MSDPGTLIVSREEAAERVKEIAQFDGGGSMPGCSIDVGGVEFLEFARSLVVAYECIGRLVDGWLPTAAGQWMDDDGHRQPMTPEQQAVMSRG